MLHELTAEIDEGALAHNVAVLRARCRAGTPICAPLKADAYGHGLASVAPVMDRLDIEMAAVATLAEAVELRGLRWRRPILVLGNVLASLSPAERRERAAVIVEHGLTPTITAADPLAELAAAARTAGRIVEVHVKFDSGMGRQGAMPSDLPALLDAINATPGLRLSGLYSHFATADLAAHALVENQLRVCRRVFDDASSRFPHGIVRHLSNTAATLELPESHFDMVRPGLGLYGYAPSPALRAAHDLRPSLRITSRVTLIKELPPGHCVGYGQTFTTRRPTRLGIVPAGYVDGFSRALSNNAIVGTSAGDAPVIGRVSMDQLTIDLTDRPSVRPGEEVVLIDHDPARPNSVESIAVRMGTIPYEVTCQLGGRMNRRVRPIAAKPT